jgi:ADP-ribose pyrophosphatase YjhB (NUDIX family)
MSKRNKDGLTLEQFLERYKPGDYERPSVTVDSVILGVKEDYSTLKVLLIQRGDHPYIGDWALPGGFINMDESAEDAASRELKEETGLEANYLEQLYTMSEPGRDPRMRVISIAYMALTKITSVKAGDDASRAVWCDIKLNKGTESNELVIENQDCGICIKYNVKGSIEEYMRNKKASEEKFAVRAASDMKLAFDHVFIILMALERLKNKAKYTNVMFSVAEKMFTLPDIQALYSLMINEKVYDKSFRDKIKPMLEDTGYKAKSIVGNKVSKLYSYKEI